MPNLIAAILAAFFAGIFLSNSINAEMHCLVIRPGFGLVSELCPAHTVSCRIRIENDAISFYEYSPLYDRNQFVCVLKGELGNQKGSGCVRKRSGHIRCWCFGRSNCNTPENSKLLYSTFASGDEAKFMAAIEQIDFVDLAEEGGNYGLQKNAAISTTTTIAKIAQKLMPKINGNGEKIKPISTTLAPIKNEKIKNKFEIEQKLGNGMKMVETTTKILEKVKLSTKSPANGKMASKTFSIHSTTTTAPSILSDRVGQNKTGQNGSQQLRSEFDRRNRIHIIHVSARDRYEPVNVFGSPALQRIMEKERKLLKAQVEKASLEGDGRDEGELEELEEDWEWGEGESQEWEREVEEANQPKKIAERSQKQKPSKNNSLLKIRLEQKQRSPDSASTELEEERALAEEYFDSAFYATGGSSKSTISNQIAFSILFPFILAILR